MMNGGNPIAQTVPRRMMPSSAASSVSDTASLHPSDSPVVAGGHIGQFDRHFVTLEDNKRHTIGINGTSFSVPKPQKQSKDQR